jgi:hypothetical protein
MSCCRICFVEGCATHPVCHGPWGRAFDGGRRVPRWSMGRCEGATRHPRHHAAIYRRAACGSLPLTAHRDRAVVRRRAADR